MFSLNLFIGTLSALPFCVTSLSMLPVCFRKQNIPRCTTFIITPSCRHFCTEQKVHESIFFKITAAMISALRYF